MASFNFKAWQIKSIMNSSLYLQTIQNYKAEEGGRNSLLSLTLWYPVFPWKFHLAGSIFVFASLGF